MVRKRDEITDSDEHNARGIELADRGWLDEAAREFTKAIQLDPTSAHAHDNLGTILAEKGDFLAALQEFIEALKVEPDSASAHHYLASFLASHGSSLAIDQYHRALELDYDFPDAHLNLALSLAERGQLEEALTELEIAHAQAPDDDIIHHELACGLIDLKRYPEAIGHLKKIIKAHPEHVEAHVDLGVAYTAQGFLAQAEEILQQAIAIDSQDFSAHYHLAALYATWGRSPEALDSLELAAKHDHEKTAQWLQDDQAFAGFKHDERYLKLIGSK